MCIMNLERRSDKSFINYISFKVLKSNSKMYAVPGTFLSLYNYKTKNAKLLSTPATFYAPAITLFRRFFSTAVLQLISPYRVNLKLGREGFFCLFLKENKWGSW